MLDDKLQVIPQATAEDLFILGYVEGILWTSTNDDGRPFIVSYSAQDFSSEAIQLIKEEGKKFFGANREDIENAPEPYSYGNAGCDFWYTRAGHRTGFCASDLPKEISKRLTAACDEFESLCAYAGNHGLLHLKPTKRAPESKQFAALGQEVISLLNLKVKKNGRVDTTTTIFATRGDKTPEGLGRTLKRLVDEHLSKQPTPAVIPEQIARGAKHWGSLK